MTVSSSQLENVCVPLTLTVVERWSDCSTPAGRLKKSFWPCCGVWKSERIRIGYDSETRRTVVPLGLEVVVAVSIVSVCVRFSRKLVMRA